MSRQRKRNKDTGSPPDPAARSAGAQASGGFRSFSQRADGARESGIRPSADDNRVIAGKDITVREARLMLSSGGGELTARELVIEALWALALSASLAWAIAVGKATVWHLLMPMAGEFVAYLAVLPVFALFFRHPELKKVSFQCLRSFAFLVAAAVIAVVIRSRMANIPFADQWNADTALLWSWIFDRQMHWPILVAALHMARNTYRSVQQLVQHGPPFLGPGMGCAMRIAVMTLATVIVPVGGMFAFGLLKEFFPKWKQDFSPVIALAWALWLTLLAADLCLLWFRWDIQNKLKGRDRPGLSDRQEKN